MPRKFDACLWLALACMLVAGPASAQSRSRARTQLADCPRSDFTNRIILLKAAAGQSLSSQMVQDLGDAYCNSSDIFRYQLDSVDFVFIDASVCPGGNLNRCNTVPGDQAQGKAWGMRAQGGYTQIGIPANLWSPGQNALKYTDFEAAVVNHLVGWSSTASNVSFNIGYPANTSWMTVLAVLAHELGHVRWAEVNIRAGFGQAYDFKRLNACSFFAGWQLNDDKDLEPKNRWRFFAAKENEKTGNDHANSPKFNPDYNNATTDAARGQLLNALLAASQPWASYLAANAPDEDYVEAYELDVLADAGLTTMPMTIPSAPGTMPDVPSDLASGNKTMLSAKINCLRKVH